MKTTKWRFLVQMSFLFKGLDFSGEPALKVWGEVSGFIPKTLQIKSLNRPRL